MQEVTYPTALVPVHEVMDSGKLAALTASMMESGWIGAPLIGWQNGEEVWLFSGSHRFRAAKVADVEIPVILLDVTYEDLVECEAVIDGVWGVSFPDKARRLPGGDAIPRDGDEG